MKQRTERMSVLVRQIISFQLVKLLPQAHITITRIEVSDDLNYATLWITSFADNLAEAELVEQLKPLRPRLQDSLAQKLKTKFTPKLRFKVDPGKEHAHHIDQLLDQIS